MGVIINRSKILWTLCLIPLLFGLFFTKSILVFLGQDELLSEYTQFYVRIGMFAFLGQLYFDIYRKILNSMGLYYVHGPVPCITMVLHLFWCYLLIWKYDLQLLGAGIAVVIQSTTNFIIIYSAVHFLGYGKESIQPFTKEAFTGWWELFKTGIPTYFLQLFAFISIEIIILLAGMLDVEILVANASLLNLLYFCYLYIYAVIQSCSPMIGNKIGAGSKLGAQKLIKANMMLTVLYCITILIIFYAFRKYLFLMYVTKESILDKMMKISFTFSIAMVCHCTKDALSGILIGLGLQNKTLVFNIVSYLLFGIPLSIFCTFYLEWIYSGPWVGLTAANLANAFYYYYLYASHDIQWFIEEYKRKHENSEK